MVSVLSSGNGPPTTSLPCSTLRHNGFFSKITTPTGAAVSMLNPFALAAGGGAAGGAGGGAAAAGPAVRHRTGSPPSAPPPAAARLRCADMLIAPSTFPNPTLRHGCAGN